MLFARFLQRWHAVDRLCANFLQRLHVLHAYLHAFTPGDMREVNRDYHRLTEVNRGTNWDLNVFGDDVLIYNLISSSSGNLPQLFRKTQF